MTKLTPAELAEIDARDKAATPGPWEWWAGNPWHAIAPNHPLRVNLENPPAVFTTGNSNSGFFYRRGVQEQAKADTAFIAAARQDIPRLRSHVDAQAEEISAHAGIQAEYERQLVSLWGKHDTQAAALREKDAEVERLKGQLEDLQDADWKGIAERWRISSNNLRAQLSEAQRKLEWR